nr:OmpA family protein [candidate division Zixibacteria bacterium]
MFGSSNVRVFFMLPIIVIFLFGVAAADISEKVGYQGNKARITVGTIKDKAEGCSWEVAESMGEMLSTALAQHDKFIVLAGKEEVDELIDEIDFGESEYVEEGRGADKGLMEGADILVAGAITGFEPDASGVGGGIGGLKKKAFGALGASKKEAKILMDLKMYDIRTRRIIKAMSLEGKATSWKVGGVGGGWTKDIALAGALGVYANEPMEGAIREVLGKAVEEIAKETPEEYFRYQGNNQYTKQYGDQGGTGTGGQQMTASTPAGTPGGAASAAVTTAAVAEDMKLYTRYDFIPGDKVIFYDDMKGEEEGEFPYRWNLDNGVYEVAKLGNEFWILATDDGNIRPKIPEGPLPEQYTVEYEFYDNGPDQSGNYHYIYWVNEYGENIGCFGFYGGDATWLEINGSTLADKALSQRPAKGSHIMRIMATSRSIKCYFDEERVANVPKVEGFKPVGFRIHHRPYNDPENPVLFRGFRFAEGGKSMREQLDETGRIVTHGILFDVDSHKIKGSSYKTLQEIGELLQADANLRLSIEGHTDSDGADDYNANLSQKRAESVRTYLVNEFGISADRLEAKGWGETKPIDTNNSAEGKANNRRVELVKI